MNNNDAEDLLVAAIVVVCSVPTPLRDSTDESLMVFMGTLDTLESVIKKIEGIK